MQGEGVSQAPNGSPHITLPLAVPCRNGIRLPVLSRRDLGSSALRDSEGQIETHLVLLPMGQALLTSGLLLPHGASSRLFWFVYHEGGGVVGKRGRVLGEERQS